MSSKEQTPITAEEFYSTNIDDDVFTLMEQYAQAKVLEALEREIPKAWKDGWSNGLSESRDIDLGFFHQGIKTKEEYYETEVQPKYK